KESLAKQQALTTRAQAAEQEALQRLAESHVRAADLAAQRGAWPLARSELEQALALDAVEEVELLPRRVRASIALGDMERAGAELDLVALLGNGKEAPRESLVSELLLLRGVVQLSDGRSRSLGQAAIRDALDGDLSEADELYAMGLLGADANRARQLFGAAIEADPFHHLAWQATLETLALSGHLLETIATAETVLQLFPDDRTALLYRAGAALLMEDESFAETCVQEAKAFLDTPAIDLLGMVPQFRKIVELGLGPEDGSQPSLAEITSRTMQLLNKANEVSDAMNSADLSSGASETLFLDSIPQLTFVVESYSLLTQSMLAQSLFQYGDAQRLLSEAVAINPSSLFYWLLGMYELSPAAPDYAAAETAYLRSLESDPFSPAFGRGAENQLLICQLELLLRGADEAVRSRLSHTVTTLMARDELSAGLCKLLLLATQHIERSDLGRVVLERWKRLDPDDPEPLAKSSFAEFEAGAYWRAVDEARAALKLSPTDTLAQRVLDDALQSLHERQSAEAVGTPP
ncbi:MAG: tetratricopeptide (TPR) repeat protein, partial [Pseudohongiellaceae bacterium]